MYATVAPLVVNQLAARPNLETQPTMIAHHQAMRLGNGFRLIRALNGLHTCNATILA
jgi:hypothetical protein